MSERSSYVTTTRREREGLYRRRIACSTAAALLFHVLLVVTVAQFRESLPFVMRSGYRGEIRLLPEISVQREASDTESEAQARGEAPGGSGFRVINLRIGELEAPRMTPTEALVEEMNPTLGDDPTNRPSTSLPQPSGQEIVIEHLVEPVYPPSAIEQGIEGVAVFGIRVEATGEVRQAWLVESEVSGECNLEAQRAVLQWRFAPYIVDGRAVPFLKYYRFRFRLTDALRDAMETARAEAEERSSRAP
jgi:TonB family protein